MTSQSLPYLINEEGHYYFPRPVTKKTIIELADTLLTKEIVDQRIDEPWIAQFFLKHQLRNQEREVFAVIYMDNKNRVLGYEEVCKGTVNENTIYPREIIKLGMDYNAAAVILCHNHPSGDPTPSEPDKEMTKLLIGILRIVDIRVIDHLIIGNTRVLSFLEEGLLHE